MISKHASKREAIGIAAGFSAAVFYLHWLTGTRGAKAADELLNVLDQRLEEEVLARGIPLEMLRARRQRLYANVAGFIQPAPSPPEGA